MKFSYTVSIFIMLSGEELGMLCQCAERHYDGNCRLSIEQGGLLWQMSTRMQSSENYDNQHWGSILEAAKDEYFLKFPEMEFELDSREIDLLRKIWEYAVHMRFQLQTSDAPGLPRSSTLKRKLVEAFDAIQAESKRLNVAIR